LREANREGRKAKGEKRKAHSEKRIANGEERRAIIAQLHVGRPAPPQHAILMLRGQPIHAALWDT